MALPAEPQDNILLHIIGQIRPVVFKHGSSEGPRWALAEGVVHMAPNRRNRQFPRLEPIYCVPQVPFVAFVLNKTLGEAARRVLHQDTIKQFRASGCLNMPCLAFNFKDYYRFFKVQLPGLEAVEAYADRYPDVSTLSRYPSLKYLEFGFHSTFDPFESSVWGDVGVTVDMIMCFAWQYVKHIRSANLTGYVKTCTRTKWLQRLALGADRSAAEVQVGNELLELKSMPAAQFPPRCECSFPCCYNTITEFWFHMNSIGHDEWKLDRLEGYDEYKKGRMNYRFDFDDELVFEGTAEENALARQLRL